MENIFENFIDNSPLQAISKNISHIQQLLKPPEYITNYQKCLDNFNVFNSVVNLLALL